jgi:hypothetical protein
VGECGRTLRLDAQRWESAEPADAKKGEKFSFSPRVVYLVAISYLMAASSAAVHGVVRDVVAARIDATLAAETGAPLLPQVLRT